MICSEEANFYEYLKIAGQKNSIYEICLNKNRVEEKAFHIIEQAWKIVKEVNREKNRARKAELQKAISAGKF